MRKYIKNNTTVLLTESASRRLNSHCKALHFLCDSRPVTCLLSCAGSRRQREVKAGWELPGPGAGLGGERGSRDRLCCPLGPGGRQHGADTYRQPGSQLYLLKPLSPSFPFGGSKNSILQKPWSWICLWG